jgi:hypothetical protein
MVDRPASAQRRLREELVGRVLCDVESLSNPVNTAASFL